MMRTASILALLGLSLGACSHGDVPADGPTGAELDEAPYGPGVELGQRYDYDLYVHCGVEWAQIDGDWWQTAPLSDGNANPPQGWGNPYHGGELVLLDDTSATFTGPKDRSLSRATAATSVDSGTTTTTTVVDGGSNEAPTSTLPDSTTTPDAAVVF